MTRITKTLTFDEEKLFNYEKFCSETGRVLSRTMELAMEEYIKNNS